MLLGNQDHPLVAFDGHVAANAQGFQNPNPLQNKQTAIIFVHLLLINLDYGHGFSALPSFQDLSFHPKVFLNLKWTHSEGLIFVVSK